MTCINKNVRVGHMIIMIPHKSHDTHIHDYNNNNKTQ